MKVLKFGGTSVGTIESLTNVKKIVDELPEPAIVVVSALGGLTDRMIATARDAATGSDIWRTATEEMVKRHHDIIDFMIPAERRDTVYEKVDNLLAHLRDIYHGVSLIRDLPERTLDLIVSFGERMSSIIVANMLKSADHYDSTSFIKTESWLSKNIADRQLTERLIKEHFNLPLDRHVVLGGFISRDRDTEVITNLGRGGSDYTAALIAAALDADLLEIWTDVDGFMTADPRIIPDATVMENMTFIESMELCSFGAKVIYPPTIYPVFHKNIPIKILNTFNPTAPGTLITDNPGSQVPRIKGISSLSGISLIRIGGRLSVNVPQINSRSFNALARHGITVLLVAQPEGDGAFSVALPKDDAAKAQKILLEEFAPERGQGDVADIELRNDMSIVAVVGEGIRGIEGLGARLVYTLQRGAITVAAVSDGASETTIGLVVPQESTKEALRLIHGAVM